MFEKIILSVRKLTSHSLIRSSAIVFAGAMAANALSYLYHLLMGRMLGPSGYGELSSLLSILYLFTVPLIVGQTVLVKFISGFKARGEVGQSKSLFVGVSKLFAAMCVIGFPVALLVAPSITSFLHLSSPALFVLVYILFAFSLLSIVTSSVLQGYQQFVWVSIFAAAIVLTKIMLSFPFIRWGVFGAIFAATFTSIIFYMLYFPTLRFVLQAKSKPTNLSKRAALGYAVPTFFTLLGITSLYSTDIILVRHFFTPTAAGLYAALAILGKIIFYASSSVALVLFPVVSERTAIGAGTKKLIRSATASVTVISALLVVLYFLFSDTIVGLLFGHAYADAALLLGKFGIFLALFSIGNIIATACLAIGKTGVWVISMLCATIQIVSIIVFHGSITGVITINIAMCMIFVLGTGGYYFIQTHEKI